jgi:hypothetical protein
MGVADQYHLRPGSAFETDFGGGYRLVLVPNFLHHFDSPTCTTFLRKVQAALQPGGAAIAELAPHADRVTPPRRLPSLDSLISAEGQARVPASGDMYRS